MSEIKRLFKGKGIKLTRQREELLKLLQKAGSPVSAEEIFLQVKRKHPNICLATIYRNLDLFVSKQLVRQLQLSGARREYELVGTGHHHYLICLGCNKTVKLANCPIHRYEEEVVAETRFMITEHRFSMYGYCPDCQESESGLDKAQSR